MHTKMKHGHEARGEAVVVLAMGCEALAMAGRGVEELRRESEEIPQVHGGRGETVEVLAMAGRWAEELHGDDPGA
jgi:hypothetical protein